MALLCYIIPFITCVILFLFFRERTVWWEYIVATIPSILLTLCLYFIFKSCSMNDTEYLGYYITKASYYEPWNEYIHRTCTREVYDGRDSDGNPKYRTEHYDCSYVEYHHAEWKYTRNCSNRETNISKEQYDQICRKFGTPKRFVDMHRHYHTIDGDKYECHFNGDRNRMWTLTVSNTYKNKILRSKSIFNFSEVPESIKKNYKLYDYPDFNYISDQTPVLTRDVYVPKAAVDSFKYLNAYYGSKYQFRCYVLLWKNAPMETSTYQQDYFVGGNKNEVCVCISVNTNNEIQWVNAFSWEDKPDIVVGVNHLYSTGEQLDLLKLNRYLLRNVPTKWKRKPFADFDYIEVMLEPWHWIVIFILTLIFNGIIIAVVINNEYDNY